MLPVRDGVAIRHQPAVTWALIAANGAVFVFMSTLGPVSLDRFIATFALIPARYFAPGEGAPPVHSLFGYLPFLTNTFLHGGLAHIFWNMWTLWMFGPAVEDRLGAKRYLAFYLAMGVAASLAHAAVNSHSVIPAIGASGAISGVMGCYARMFPTARLIILIPIFFLPLFYEIPALLFIGVWFLTQLAQGVIDLASPSSTGAGVAWWAHIGGFIAGVLMTPMLRRPEAKNRRYFDDEGVFGFKPTGRR